MNSLLDLSDALFLHVNDVARSSGWLHAPATVYATYGLAVFAGLILLGVARRRAAGDRQLAVAVWAGLGTIIAVGVNQPVAAAVGELRPYAVHPSALVLVDRTADWSFPSDHAVMAGAATVGLLLVSRRLGLVAAGAALLMAATRVYVGAHYPHDVIVGLVLGGLVSGVGWLVLQRPVIALVRLGRNLPLADRVLSATP
ncbi:MAG: phosphatase PAP2 family protein [Terracoccus sp.]